MLARLLEFLASTGFAHLTLSQLLMIIVSLGLLYLGIAKKI